ncbi:hypothetical protein EES39_09705 [Streptomyces sp. ADI92-24]|nr:hypothetical protein EDD95_0547 [Streptomyces sp. CEV 2-1]RPK48418.1 hypothetical protein EES39_09705 [Streptomyces sp. ADI92-24]
MTQPALGPVGGHPDDERPSPPNRATDHLGYPGNQARAAITAPEFPAHPIEPTSP